MLRPSSNAGDVYMMGVISSGLAPGAVRVKLAGARLLYKDFR